MTVEALDPNQDRRSCKYKNSKSEISYQVECVGCPWVQERIISAEAETAQYARSAPDSREIVLPC